MEEIRPIRTQADLDWALTEVERYFDMPPKPGSAEEDRYDILSELIAAYEQRHFAIEALDPVDTIKAYMEETRKSQTDLAALIGSRSRASEILNRKRALSLTAIRKIAEAWHLPADDLIAIYPLAA